MAQFIISITSRDRSGIVAAITEGIFSSSGNVLAASQTVHQGYFAMIVLADFDDGIGDSVIAQSINDTAGGDLHVFVTPYDPNGREPGREGSAFVVTCLGPDHPGILRILSRFLASRNVNIDDLYCTVDDNDFVVICQVTMPAEADVFVLQTDLAAVGRDAGFTITLQHENIFLETTRP